MRVARLHGARDLRLADEPDSVPGAGEQLVRVTAVGLCGSDRHWFSEGRIGEVPLEHPLVLGHEVAGVVVGGERDGIRVVVDPAEPCLRCAVCLEGRAHLCPSVTFLGYDGVDGGLRSLAAWPSRRLLALPASVGDAAAAMIEPLGIALHAVDLAGPRAPGVAGVFGCGPIGLLLVALLHRAGWSVIATDPLEHRVEAARRLGARDGIVVAPTGSPPADLPPTDVAFEVAGEDAAVADAVHSVRPGGRVVLVGIPSGERTAFSAAIARRKELRLLLCRRMAADDLRRAIGVAADGWLDLDGLVSERQPLEAVATAFEGLVERRGLKIVVEPAAG